MMHRIEMAELSPDRVSARNPGLDRAVNLIPVADGYVTIPDLRSLSRGSLDAVCIGADSFRTQAGNNVAVAGTTAKLFVAQGDDLTDRSGATYATAITNRWEHELYGTDLLATNFTDAIQVYDTTSHPTTYANLHADAPNARHFAVIDEFLVCGNIISRGIHTGTYGTQEAGVHWSGRGDPTSWLAIGTDAALAVQSDWQPLPDDGGEITAMVSGAEWGLVLREREVRRIEYVGADRIFAFEVIEQDRGCVVHGGAITVGNVTYYPSEEGFMACNGAECVPIGHEKIDREFRTRINLADAFRASVTHHHAYNCVIWYFPVERLGFIFNYRLGKWTTFEKSLEWIFSAMPLASSLDSSPYATQDMDAASPTGLGDLNLDELGGATIESLVAFDTDHELCEFAAEDTLLGELETGWLELSPGARSLLRWARPVYEGEGMLVGAASSAIAPSGDASSWTPYRSPNTTAKIALRRGGPYHKLRFQLQGAIRGFKDCDLFYETVGGR